MIHTRIFGDIEVDANKIITFDGGIIGFPELKRFMLIHDRENEKKHISWLQSIDEPDFAMPVIDPLKLVEDYNPIVEDELLSGFIKDCRWGCNHRDASWPDLHTL